MDHYTSALSDAYTSLLQKEKAQTIDHLKIALETLESLPTKLSASGRSLHSSPYNPSSPIIQGSHVAYKPKSGSDWIVCRVERVISETKFEVRDPEPDDDHQGALFIANGKEIILLPIDKDGKPKPKLKSYKSGMKVLAKYPETTAFYPAEFVENRGTVCMLRFEGEEEVGKLTAVDRVYVLPWPKGI
ncbi:Sgf29 protein [Martiniozyma asiatica (nom. inval.)]|nr:Sgf29 protein [Martiniozyma asiatica]